MHIMTDTEQEVVAIVERIMKKVKSAVQEAMELDRFTVDQLRHIADDLVGIARELRAVADRMEEQEDQDRRQAQQMAKSMRRRPGQERQKRA